MRRPTRIDLDLALVREAAEVLGTEAQADTIHAALAEVVSRQRRATLAQMDLPDLVPEMVEGLRSARDEQPRPR
jgi:Arc/MetJ family transcription regulator